MKRALIATAFLGATFLCVSARADDEMELSIANLPAPSAELLIIDQPLGRLTISGWDKPEVQIVARKRARDGRTLDRLKVGVEMLDGNIHVRTGVRIGDSFRSLPVESAGIDLTVYAPRRVQLRATTWSGNLEASGFRRGAELASSSGEVRATDIEGKVQSSALNGRQWLQAIHGDVWASGGVGDVELTRIDGDVLDARVVDGQITAREVSTPVVRMFSTAGGVIFVGTLRTGGRYELGAEEGDVRLTLTRVPFSVAARASGTVTSGFTLRGRVAPHEVAAEHQGGGPQLLLSAVHGNVSLQPLP
jgi:hypothetical protein